MTGKARSYQDPCGIARGLDVVGERWALLVVRELLLGAKRFGDLRAGLPGASPNVLSQRLRELEDSGVLRRRKLGPPANVWVYELTAWGRDLEPVVLALGRWGGRSAARHPAQLSLDALMLALKTTFEPADAGDLHASFALEIGDETFHATVRDRWFTLARGIPEKPDAVLRTDVGTLRDLVFGDRKPASALRGHDLELAGDRHTATRFLRLFPRPVTAPDAG